MAHGFNSSNFMKKLTLSFFFSFFLIPVLLAGVAPVQQNPWTTNAANRLPPPAVVVTNFGVFSANSVYVSKSLGVASPAVGDPNRPYLTAQSASYACPSNGTVVVCDGTFNEQVIVTNAQNWFFADNTYLDSFLVQPSAGANFAVSGLGTIGLQNMQQNIVSSSIIPTNNYFSNNFSNLRIECKNWFGAWAYGSAVSGATVTVTARDTAEGLGHMFMLDRIPQTYTLSASAITNLSLFSQTFSEGVGCFTNGLKTFNFNARFMEMRPASGTTSALLVSNTFNFNLNNGRFLIASGSSAARPAFPTGTATGIRVLVQNADVYFGPLSLGSTMAKVTSTTNELAFVNCRLSLGAAPISYTSGQLNTRYSGCVSTLTNAYAAGQVVILADNTLIDTTWTNAGYRY